MTATSVRLFSTVTRSGLAATFGQDPVPVLTASFDRVNRAGGVCGRRLDLTVADDGGSAETGTAHARKALDDGVLAMPFVGASDVLDMLVDTGDLARTRTPVVLATRDARFYGREWVWPVGVADTTAARLMVRDAYGRGARTFGVVFDEPAVGAAFDAEVWRLTGRHVAGYAADGSGCDRHYCGPQRGSGSPRTFYTDPPDFAGLLVDEERALTWQQDPFTPRAGDLSRGTAGLDPLLGYGFRNQCGSKCDGLRVWSAYKASCGSYADDPAVRRYEADLAARSVDDRNDRQIAAMYAAGQLLVSAVRRSGPELTRDRLARVLRTASLRADLTVAETLSFGAGGNRTMRAYVLGYKGTVGPCALGPIARG